MQSAIIHFEPVFSKYDQGIFFKRALKRCKRSFIIEGKEFFVYLVPIFLEKPSEKALSRWIDYVKEEGVRRVIVSKTVKGLKMADSLREAFSVYDGKSVINYKLYDILRKCAGEKGVNLSDSTLMLSSNDPERVKEAILKCYQYVRKITLKTNHPERFSELSAFFLEEYGLYISLHSKEPQNDSILQIDLDGFEEHCDFSYNIEKSQVYFSKKHLFAGLMPYSDLDQGAVEFLAENLKKSHEKNHVREFFDRYLLRITKIKNND